MSSEQAVAEAIVTRYMERGGAPAIAWGIVRDGELVASGGAGTPVIGPGAPGAGPPGAGTVFRIASMSKSFTAAAVLLLRDEGKLALDDLAAAYVPAVAGWPPVTPDSAPVTIRHLLTMTAGFPTDDPWGDRQQGLPLDEFAALLARGVSVNWAPGTRFEYSNLGYAILGLVIAAASGVPYAEFVRARLLEPLGLARTGYEAAPFEGARPAGPRPGEGAGLARGYRHGPGGWEEVPLDPYGAFAPMGGVFSCVRDLATWVAGFASAFPPGAGGPGGGAHPLRASSRREMQLPQAVIGGGRGHALPGGLPGGPGAYGLGLFVDEDAALGRIVSHSGGYPGFGSNMRWHSATGTGAIALGNGTYAPMTALTTLLLQAVVPRRSRYQASGYQVALAPEPGRPRLSQPGGPWVETLAAREAVTALLSSWDAGAAALLFSENVALDRPYAERLADIARLRDRIGDLADDPARPPECDTPAHCRWFLAGPGGTAAAQIQLSPELPPRVMSLTLAIPPAAGSPLAATLDAVIGWLNGGAAAWPQAIAVAPGVSAALLSRRLRMAAIWTGPVAPGAFRAGDGATTVTVELAGEHAPALLTVTINPVTGALRAAEATL
ncbi:MAG TPA: serine hydrolase domain-containing protein [Trebonia sp.]|nr:serine hydrolase domain-containing protein [Trebonia sp.]